MEEANFYAPHSNIRFAEVNIKIFIMLRLVFQSRRENSVGNDI